MQVTDQLATSVNVPPVGKRQEFIAFARGFAILTIVLYHLLPKLPLPGLLLRAISLGGSGIYIYFFVSGYGLSLSSTTNWLTFFRRRFAKVLLPYYVAVTLIFVVTLFVPIYRTDGWAEYLSHIALYKMVNNTYTRNLDEYLWFVSTIIQFYLIVPLLMRWVDWTPAGRVIGLSITISLLYSLLITELEVAYLRVWYSFVLQYLWLFMLGIVIARSKRLPLPVLITQTWYVYVITGGLSLLGALWLDYWLGRAGSVFNDYFLFTAYASLLVLCYQVSRYWTFISQFVRWTESFSYGLYLIHMPVYRLYMYATGGGSPGWYDLPFIFLFMFGVAILFQRLIINRLMPTRLASVNGPPS